MDSIRTPFKLQNLLPFQASLRKMTADAIAREESAMRIGALAPDRLTWLLEEAQRRQDVHEEWCRQSSTAVVSTAGLDSVYEDVCKGLL